MTANPLFDFFGRVAIVQVDIVKTGSARVQFDIHKNANHEPNKIKLSIFNLAEDTRAKLSKQDVFVVVEAGYQSATSIIFNGFVRAIEHVREHTEWVTRVTGGDGEKQIRYERANLSFQPGSTAATVLKGLAQATGLGLGNVSKVISKNSFRKGTNVFTRGFVAHGAAWGTFVKVARRLGYQASSQDGEIKLTTIDDATDELAVELDQESGLIGSPEVAEKGLIKATSLLNGELYPGRKVRLKSARYDGFYKVHTVNHKGDTHGKDWFSIALLAALSKKPASTPEPG